MSRFNEGLLLRLLQLSTPVRFCGSWPEQKCSSDASKKPDKTNGDEDQTESNQNFQHALNTTIYLSVEQALSI